MSHHGWVDVIDIDTISPDALKSPFGRMMAAQHHNYSSHAIALLTGAFGPMQGTRQAALLGTGPSPLAVKKGNPAGFTFLGQFIDHDMTEFRMIGPALNILDANPTIGQRQTVLEDLGITETRLPTTTNGRTGKLDLDAVYGLLGGAQPDLFDETGEFVMEMGDKPDIKRGTFYRNKRLIADPRNDENKLIVQIHLLFERLHNKIHKAKDGGPERKGATGDIFKETRAQVTSAYHRIVLHDYLPRIVQEKHLMAVLDKLESGETLYQKMNTRNRKALEEIGFPPEEAAGVIAMPVEFAHAAFRLGHSQLLGGYELRPGTFVPLFDTASGQPDLRGDKPLAEDPGFHVDWSLFFKTAARDPQHGNPIDGSLADAIFRLPPPAVKEPPVSLAERNIRRGVDFGLPSGQNAAAELAEVYGYIPGMSVTQIFPPAIYEKVAEVLETAPELQWATPLWYYILMEAGISGALDEDGKHDPQLGAVGGLIVAETLLGSLVEARLLETSGSTLAGEVGKIRQAYDDIPPSHIEQDSGPLHWDKDVAGVGDIYTMSQLIKFVSPPVAEPATGASAMSEKS